jgi:hypothetical protein
VHASSDRGPQIQIGKRAAVALALAAATVLSSCASSSSDSPGLSGPQRGPSTTVLAEPSGPAISVIRVSGLPVPQLVGKAAVNAQLATIGSKLSGTCTVSAERDDRKIASFLWSCAARPTAATFDLSTDRQLSLDDLFQGGYKSYLSSTAVTQMQADGTANPSATDFAVWYLTPDSLVVDFPAGMVSFPLSSLGIYLRPGSPLKG